jgi:Tol biopolymer transport system component
MSFVTLHSTAIYVMRADGSALRRLTEPGSFAGSPSWTADGKQLLFYGCDLDNVNKITSPRRLRGVTQLYTLDIASGRVVPLTSGPGEKWSPHRLADGRIGYVTGGPEGGVAFLSGEPGMGGEARSPSWSPDGRSMLFHRDVGESWPPFQRWKSPVSDVALIRTGVFPSFEPGGGGVVMNDKTAGILHNDIIRLDAAGSVRRLLFHDETRSALAPTVSPDGKQIAFGLGGFFQMTSGKAIADLAVINADGSGLKILTDGKGNYGLPAWSPDQTQIVYRAATGDHDGLYILDVATGASRFLAGTSAHDNFPAWSPVGDRISFTSNRDGDYEIYTIKADGSGLTRLTRSPGNDAHNSWSPDGKWIAFTSARGGFKDEAVLHPFNPQPLGDLYMMRADGSDVRRLTDNQYEEGTPGWAPLQKPGSLRR